MDCFSVAFQTFGEKDLFYFGVRRFSQYVTSSFPVIKIIKTFHTKTNSALVVIAGLSYSVSICVWLVERMKAEPSDLWKMFDYEPDFQISTLLFRLCFYFSHIKRRCDWSPTSKGVWRCASLSFKCRKPLNCLQSGYIIM